MIKIRRRISYIFTYISITLVSLLLSECTGFADSPDLSPLDVPQVSSSCLASECHSTAPLETYPPTSGLHSFHIQNSAPAGSNALCHNCHWDYNQNPLHRNGFIDGYDAKQNLRHAGEIVRFGGIFEDGSLVRARFDPGSGRCEEISCHSFQSAFNWYADFDLCANCHLPGSLIDPLTTGGTGMQGKHQRHVAELGYACNKCHLHYPQNDNHFNGVLDSVRPEVTITYFDSTNSAGAFINDTGPRTGNCANLACHAGDTMTWYGPQSWSIPACSVCHSAPTDIRRTVLGASGDFAANGVRVSHHVTDSVDPADDQCLVCHGLVHHMAGNVQLRHGDSAALLTYHPDNPAGLEDFCLSCHDLDGATSTFAAGGSAKEPFADGSTLGAIPYMAGERIAGYWNNVSTVHRDRGLTCAGDGEAPTGGSGSGCHGSGGRVNMHGSLSRGLLTKNLTLPGSPSSDDPLPRRPTNSAWVAHEELNFELCFDCHDSYPSVAKEVVLGYREMGEFKTLSLSPASASLTNEDVHPTPYYTPTIGSMFREHCLEGQGGNNSRDCDWDGLLAWDGIYHVALHNYHMLSPNFSMVQNIWNYRGAEVGRASCPTCHNVHGTSGTIRGTHDEFGLTRFGSCAPWDIPLYGGTCSPDPLDEFTGMNPTSNYDNVRMQAFPIYCAASCHFLGWTSYWNMPGGE